MKTLQNNFTTPEQSKRLLELGVPVLTADCYFYVQEINGRNVCDTPNLVPYGMGEFGLRHWWINRNNARYIPCWSVGRLMEIYHICDKPGCSFTFNVCFPNLVSEMIYKIAEAKEHGWIDFSKLED